MNRYQLMNIIAKEERAKLQPNMKLHKLKFNVHYLSKLLAEYEKANYRITTAWKSYCCFGDFKCCVYESDSEGTQNIEERRQYYQFVKDSFRWYRQFLTGKNIFIKEIYYCDHDLPDLEIILPMRDTLQEDEYIHLSYPIIGYDILPNNTLVELSE